MKLKKSERERFVREAALLIGRYGGRQSDHGIYPLEIDTLAGILRLDILEHLTSGPGAVMGRFENLQLAAKMFAANPYTGKWNSHYFGDWSVDDALADIECWLKRLTDATWM